MNEEEALKYERLTANRMIEMIKSKIVASFILMSVSMIVRAQEEIVKINDTLTASTTLVYLDSFQLGLQNWKVEQMPKGAAHR
ncbi:hypothetical protein [Zobellia laminariae]|uniref:hypothetical protein n=1 Tax=Zobellia laminariae TaxID=248906 RepID=UPI0026F4755B|nr:hypothetical protein [Zobellia laminariae]WKX76780.1 hypothetical protein Q5W13_00970 [Zobellia laminariae]